MNRIMKKPIISLLLAALMLCSMIPTAFSATNEAIDAANALYDLGLFNGIGINPDGTPNFDLDRTPTRHEAITMLVALLGKSDEAQNGNWSTPFVDVADWAKPYVGYAYANGLTSGTSATTYGGNQPVTATQYLTFVLTALGYKNGVDFQWDKAWELSDKIGLTDGRYNAYTKEFLRSDVAIISNNALNVKLKNSDAVLLSVLNLEERVLYDSKIFPLSDSAVIIEISNIVVRETGKEYVDASFVFKGSKYTNMASSYTLDSFFYSEFPQYKSELIGKINDGLISCVEYNGKIYINNVNAIQFFRQYGIEFYHNYEVYQYVTREIESSVPDLTKDPVEYSISFQTPSEVSVIYDRYDIYSKATEKIYSNALVQIKSSPYTNMITGYFHDEFFFNEFPDYEYEIKKAVNNGEISGITMDGNIYLETVNMIQFFRQYSIEFYHGSENYSYKKSAE